MGSHKREAARGTNALKEHCFIDVGLVMAGLGEQEREIDWLEKAYHDDQSK